MDSSSSESEDKPAENSLPVRFSVKTLRELSIHQRPEQLDDMEKKRCWCPHTIDDFSEKKFHGTRKSGTLLDYSNFGNHLTALNHGSFKRSGCSSGYASELGSNSDFDSWGSDTPCSFAQHPVNSVRERSFKTKTSSWIEVQSNKTPDVFESSQGVATGQNEYVSVQTEESHVSFPEYNKEVRRKHEESLEQEPDPFDKIDCDTWFSESTYGHLLINVHPADVVHPINQYIENLTRRREKSWIRKKMPLLFGKSHKSPAEVVKNLREVLILVDKGAVQDKKLEKALEEISKNVSMIKAFIYGNDSTEPSSEHVIQVAQLAQEVYNANILPMLVKLLPRFDFECKKDVGQIFNNLLRRQIGTRSPTVEYLGARPEILLQLVQGYSQPDIALTCGSMLRESIRHDHLAKIILYSDVFYTFFKYVQSEVFDIASDAFSTFKDLTTRHKSISAEFLDANYDVFFGKDQYQSLLNSKNYVTRRQSLKLLGELLLDRHNFNIMTKYISNPDNLKLMMELLRDKSRNIQYEAFHVFKVFVANPNKPKPISDILNRNRDKLVEFLGEFHNDRTDDEQFNDEKAYLIKQIQEMRMSPKEPKKTKSKEGDQAESSEASPSPDQQHQ